MTKRRDFKKRIRARQRKTRESYMAAKHRVDAQQRKLLSVPDDVLRLPVLDLEDPIVLSWRVGEAFQQAMRPDGGSLHHAATEPGPDEWVVDFVPHDGDRPRKRVFFGSERPVLDRGNPRDISWGSRQVRNGIVSESNVRIAMHDLDGEIRVTENDEEHIIDVVVTPPARADNAHTSTCDGTLATCSGPHDD